MTNLSKFAALAIIALTAPAAQADVEAEAEETPLYEYLIPIRKILFSSSTSYYKAYDPENDSMSLIVTTDGSVVARLKGNEVLSDGDGYFVTNSYREDEQGNKPSRIYDSEWRLLGSYNCELWPLGQNRFSIEPGNDSCGLMDVDGKIIAPPAPYRAYYPGGNGVLIYNHNTKEESPDYPIAGYYGLCSLDGKEITPAIYDRIGAPQDGVFPMARNNKSGFLDSLGNEVLAPAYDYDEFWGVDGGDYMEIYHHDGKFLVPRDGKYGLVDQSGKTIIPFEYTGGNFEGKYIVLHKENDYVVFDLSGRKLNKSERDIWSNEEIRMFSKFVGGYWKYGFFDKTGKEVIPCIYDEVVDFYEGKALVRRGDIWDVIDTKGNVLVKALTRFVELH